MAGNRQPTVNDVARLAGVSKSAVSRAFTGGSVSDDTRRKVEAAARELRYRPSQAGRALKTNRSRLIGLAVTHLDNQFYPEVIERISEALALRGSRLVLFITRGQMELEPMLDELLGFGLDGVILASSSMAAEVARECMAANMPAIMFNNIDPDGTIPGISTDNAHGAAAIAAHLIGQGHRRIGIITGVADSSTTLERVAAFVRALAEAGLPDPEILCADYAPERAADAARELLQRDTAPTALFCLNDHMAFAVLDACRAAGYVPGVSIAVCGFDDVAIAGWEPISLTTYAQPMDQLVAACVERLFAQIEGRDTPSATLRLPGELKIRQSTAFRPVA